MVEVTIVPDSSFYICFLDDINKPQYFIRMLSYETFKFVSGPLIKKEIINSSNYPMIEKVVGARIQIFVYYNYGEILRPLFSFDEIKRGEHEVIVISYILYLFNIRFITILDDNETKKFLLRNFPHISTKVTGTIGFVKLSCCTYKIFSKDEAISILNLIKKSRFRVKGDIVDQIMEEIKRC
ncbi:MAG: hypothetical protein COW47_00600 [Candidatus Huberarchaeum crystalense]|uniref:PIN domain-containing protein n=2 Tax=Nanobdellati TaxID=1783276 RepID=A0A2H9MMS9_HUBC1|nr:MAG: hypothetical protein AUK59_01825 [Candidatus Altarchaeum sp. CG2_30_32_3053]PIV13787.1 MAG: hypothetical protein COS45_00915 [Candidatus Huberarchaeum crystalense]PIZ31068.1 MAG: hypothetical protein COY41_03055 [Candidatus Altarchaeum sp. CG_4_10_14_0_8_um_filter_32_851]PJC14948.1 MAG: hypothetical protein CO063_02160 [Candidatus Altarchaeum sp. CG_4_9_14_0_8_um_filter_32_206]PIV89861.1 MAG: hypothetical protein COW47_00600 [Candidatus Huberarchaeum crystalense]